MRGKRQFWLHLILILSLVISTAFVSPVTASPTALYVDPDSIIDKNLGPGTGFTVDVAIEDVTDLFGFEFKLIYNTSVLTATSFTILDDFFTPPIFPWHQEINDTAGYVWVGVTKMSIEQPGDTGSGPLVTIEFTVDSFGETILDLDNVKLSDSSDPPNPIEHEVYDGFFANIDLPPVASFATSTYTPWVTQEVFFDASASYDLDGYIVSYFWDFDDGNTSTGITTTYTYMTQGTYNVTLTITDSQGLTDTTWKLITVYLRDVALVNVTAYPTEVNKTEPVFINATVANEGDLSETFDVTMYYDSVLIDTQTVLFLEAGATKTLYFTWDTTYVPATTTGTTYNISAKTSELPYDANTTNNEFIDGNVTVYKPPGPSANFTYSPSTPLEGEPVNFDASHSTRDPITNAPITSYAWDFGDGTTEIYMGANLTDTATHPYAAAGSYLVKLNVTDSLGLWDATETTVNVYRHDVAIISVTPDKTEVIIGELVPIDVTAKNEGNFTETFNVAAYYDGKPVDDPQTAMNLEAGTNKTLTFTWDTANVSPGVYTIKANATIVEGETELHDNEMFFDGTVRLFSPPVASFTENATTVLTGEVIRFNATNSYDLDGDISDYFWTFDDGTNSTGILVEHTYDDNGTYTVTLTVTDDDDLTNSTMAVKTVLNRPPAALFTESATIVLTGEVIYFNATDSYDLDGDITDYFWTFDDGTNATGVLVEHTYDDDGTYTVTLTVTDDDGTSDSISATKTVSNRPPVASFNWSSLEPAVGDEINFTSTGTDPDGVIESWEWDFDDDGTVDATTEIASWTYDEAGAYTVSLTVTDNDGLTDTTTKSVTVNEAPAGFPLELIAAIVAIIIIAGIITAYYLIRRKS